MKYMLSKYKSPSSDSFFPEWKCSSGLLKDFVDRFEAAMLLISDLYQYIALTTFINGLPKGHKIGIEK